MNIQCINIGYYYTGVHSDDANPTSQTTLALKRLEKIVETDHKHLLTKVQQTFRGWRARRHVFGNLPPSTPWSTRTLGRALERRRAGRVVVKNAQKYCL